MANKAKNKAKNKQAAKRAQVDRAAKGNAQYNDVTTKPFDIKVLVAQVAKAQAAKTKSTSKVNKATKKALIADAAHAKEEAVALEEDAKVIDATTAKTVEKTRVLKNQRKKVEVPSVDAEDATEKVRLFSVVVATKVHARRLTTDSIAEVDLYQRRAREAILALPVGSTPRLALFSKYTEISRSASKLKPTQDISKTPNEQPKNQAQDTKDKLLGKGSKEVKSWKTLDRVLSLVGKGKDGVKTLRDKGRTVGTSLAPISSSASTLAVRGIASIGPGLKHIGKSINKNGVNTLKWIGSRLSSLTRSILGMFRGARNMFASGGDAGDWVAMAALGIGVLPQIVQGMLDELKKRFGEDFVVGFIKEKWESTKATVTQWLSEFIDKALGLIKELPAKIAEGATYLADKTREGASAVVDTSAYALKSLFISDEKKEAERARMKQGPSAMDKLGGLLADHSAPGITPAKKTEIAGRIRELVSSSPSLYNNSQVIANLEKRGIKIDAKLAQTTNNTSTSTATPGAVSNSTNISGGPSGAPVSTGGGNAISASPPTPATDTPVTAQPPAPPSVPADGKGDAGTSTPKTGGLSNATVPDNAAPESLFFMNLASMGAA